MIIMANLFQDGFTNAMLEVWVSCVVVHSWCHLALDGHLQCHGCVTCVYQNGLRSTNNGLIKALRRGQTGSKSPPGPAYL